MYNQIKVLLIVLFSTVSVWSQSAGGPPPQSVVSAEKALSELQMTADNIDIDQIKYLPVQQNGRLKPLDTLSREVMLYLNGSYSR